MSRKFSRRILISALGVAGSAVLLGACGAPATPTQPPAKPVEKPAAAAPAATSAPVSTKPIEAPKPAEAAKPAEAPKPAEAAKPAEAPKPTVAPAADVKPAAAVAGKVGMWVFPLTTDDANLYKPMVEDFQKANSAISVDMQILPWDGRSDKMIASLAANTPPDGVYLNPDFYPRFVDAKELEAFDPYLPPGYRDDFNPGPLDAVTYGGKTYGAPILTSAYTNVINEDVFKASGLDPAKLPGNWDELQSVMKTMTKPADGQFGAYFDMKRPSPVTNFVPIMWQAGGEMYAEDGKSVTFNQQPGIEALEFMAAIYQNNWAQKSNITGGGLPFSSGKVGLSFQTEPNAIKKSLQENPQLKLLIPPTAQKTKKVNFGTVGSYAIFTRSKNKDAAAKWILALTSPKNTTTILAASGFISPRKSITADAYAKDPLFLKIVAEAPFMRSEPKHIEARSVFDAMMPEIQAALLGQKSAKDALNTAAEASNKLLKK